MRNIITSLFVIVSMILISGCTSFKGGPTGVPVTEVVNTGVAYSMGGGATKSQKFPYISRLNQDSLNNTLRAKLSSAKISNFKIVKLGDKRDENGNKTKFEVDDGTAAMSFVIDFEKTYVKQRSEFDNKWHLRAYVGGRALFYDFMTKKIIASYPFMIISQEILDSKPSESYIQSMYSKIFGPSEYRIKNSDNLNIFDFFIDKISDIKVVRKANDISIGIGRFTVDSKVWNLVSDIRTGSSRTFASQNDLAEFMTNSFNSAIFKNFNVDMVPYATKNGIYIQMLTPYKDENGELKSDMVLKLPESTYKIDLNLAKLYKENREDISERDTYRALYNISLRDFTNKVIFSEGLGAFRQRGGKPDDNDEYMRCLIELNKTAGERIEDESKYGVLADIIEKCR